MGYFTRFFYNALILIVVMMLVTGIVLINNGMNIKKVPFILIMELGVVFLVYSISVLVVLTINNKRKKNVSDMLDSQGYSDEYFSMLKKYVDKSSEKNKAMAMISLAGELSDAGKSKEAISVLKQISLVGATDEVIADYYNAYIYILIMGGDLENAEIAYGAGRKFLDMYKDKKSNGAAILHTLGVLEYARGNLPKAENLFILAKARSKHQDVENTCNMFLALIYLKTGRLIYAKKITADTIPNIKNPRQKQDIIKLMKLVESAYGL